MHQNQKTTKIQQQQTAAAAQATKLIS